MSRKFVVVDKREILSVDQVDTDTESVELPIVHGPYDDSHAAAYKARDKWNYIMIGIEKP